MSISSDEVNFLLYRYLVESGFSHAAYTFGNESQVTSTDIHSADVPPGALITIIQKGLMYVEAEAVLDEDGFEAAQIERSDPFWFLAPNKYIKAIQSDPAQRETKILPLPNKKRRLSGKSATSTEASGTDWKAATSGRDEVVKKESEDTESNTVGEGHENGTVAISSKEKEEAVALYQGHTNDVYACRWHPTNDLLASGSGDCSARIWNIAREDRQNPLVLSHPSEFQQGSKSQDNRVTMVAWNNDGSTLATGDYSGTVRLWSNEGVLRKTITKHKRSVFALRWNPCGSHLASTGFDKTVCVVNSKTGLVEQQFAFHQGPVLDVDWCDNKTFASGSADYNIHVCRVGESEVVKTFTGHKEVINQVRWDKSSQFLGSCADDETIKVWTLRDGCVQRFEQHTKPVFCIAWSPSEGASQLASGSEDSLLKLWDIERGTCIRTFKQHVDTIYSVAFSPCGRYLASGSLDKKVNIWNIKDRKLMKSYEGTGGIVDLSWNSDGNKVAACFDDIVAVIDFRM